MDWLEVDEMLRRWEDVCKEEKKDPEGRNVQIGGMQKTP